VAAISAFRVFGLSDSKAAKPVQDLIVNLISDIDMEIAWTSGGNAVGHAVLWGYAPNKLYHSCMTYGQTRCHIGALNAGQPLYVRVDSFNEAGITEGTVVKVNKPK